MLSLGLGVGVFIFFLFSILRCNPRFPDVHHVAQVGLKLFVILLSQSPECLDHRHEPPYLALVCGLLCQTSLLKGFKVSPFILCISPAFFFFFAKYANVAFSHLLITLSTLVLFPPLSFKTHTVRTLCCMNKFWCRPVFLFL